MSGLRQKTLFEILLLHMKYESENMCEKYWSWRFITGKWFINFAMTPAQFRRDTRCWVSILRSSSKWYRERREGE